jgi:hypothetical protein
MDTNAMKIYPLGSILFFLAVPAVGQNMHSDSRIIPFLDPESQTNIVIRVNALRSEPQVAPPHYTNVISNTNLFSMPERRELEAIPLKYQHVTTNTGPVGTRLVTLTNAPLGAVAVFQHTNFEASEEIGFSSIKSVRFRTGTGDGYDVHLNPRSNAIINYCQVRSNVVDGLLVSFFDARCVTWMRFVNGKAVGKWIVWGTEGELLIEAEFKEPYDFFKHSRQIKWR